MGMFKLFSPCSLSDPEPRNPTKDQIIYNNPDPSRFVIEKIKSIENFTIVKVHYPNCNNYEGRKILVYKNIISDKIIKSTALDPHFCDDDTHISPVARFEPTNRGWRYAISFCKSIKK